jgi:hypothetical protein
MSPSDLVFPKGFQKMNCADFMIRHEIRMENTNSMQLITVHRLVGLPIQTEYDY